MNYEIFQKNSLKNRKLFLMEIILQKLIFIYNISI